MLLLIFVPLAVDNVFRAIAAGVNNASGHADGSEDSLPSRSYPPWLPSDCSTTCTTPTD